ncbi:phosphoribosylglycinamide formyltransferase, formyltetrahydrofolate-dependent [Thermanaerovibrio velox DSM 12556]|uniref:Phosphoribosylglycinamide formyltransferase n=1 Tax=Thermanaerovibrio velox DSM 12556 TaxID=926567 RepID=H0US74_9BACT|nr:phosphoribosylglycinamide formyltransferase [Thermanaerovibrio velox]EHM10163.1 phosphoribosylglycinamide formyltransferase, formyltetrahydrofolate-dependent [Thermanaerovibrio velox DSM 12556]
MRTPIGILISGRGSNLMAIKSAADAGLLRAHIAFVGSDNPAAPGLTWAREQGLQTIELDYSSGRLRGEEQLEQAMVYYDTHHLVLAGFMRILSERFVERHKGMIINIHPSLLPSFPGKKGIEEAFRYGVKVTGVTVHIVDEQVDHGPILAQEAVTVEEGDTLQDLEDKIHGVEHKIYPVTIDRWLEEGDFSLPRLRRSIP